MTLTLTPLPSNVSAKSLLPNTDPATGIVIATGRPTRHAWAVGQTVLAAMGVRLDMEGAGRRHGEDLEYLNAWLTAYGVRVLVIRHATNIQNTEVLDNLLYLTTAVGVDLALTSDDTVAHRLADWVCERSGHVDTDHQPLIDRLTTITTTTMPSVTRSDSDFPALLPRVDFYGFRARCRDVLTPQQFDMVNRRYVDVFKEVQADPFATSTEAAERITVALQDSDNVGKALTTLRAAQAAMFTHGLLLKVNLGYFLNGVQESEHRRLTDPEIRALRAYRTPWRSSVVVLRDADLTRDQIAALKMADIADSGHPSGVDHLPLSDDAALYLRAQRILRLLQGAQDDDAFLPLWNRYIGRAQRRAAIDLNLPIVHARERTHTSRGSQWKTNLGALLVPLVTRTLPSAHDIKNGTPT